MFKRSVKMRAWSGVLTAILVVGVIKNQPITGVLAAFGVLLICFCLSTLWLSVCVEFFPDSDEEAVFKKLARESIFNFET